LHQILIVEDEALVRMAVADFLEDTGFGVVEAGSGSEAVGVLEERKSQIDLVFSDIRMPGPMDGFQLALWIRKYRPSLPVFLTSGDIGKAQTTFELAPGQPFFLKPYDLDKVVARMRDTLAEALGSVRQE
jgi:CheY-like chemotaxis protein